MTLENTFAIMKLVIIGDTSVGKTCLLNRYDSNEFNDNFVPTVGVVYKLKKISVEDVDFNLQIWDTAGQERFRSITQSYYRGSDGALIVFDVTDRQSFENMSIWINDFQDFTDQNQNIIIVGNKADAEKRAITTEEAEAFAQAKNFKYIETSAKTGLNVNEAFNMIEEIIYEDKKGCIKLKCYPKSVDIAENREKKGCC